MTYARILAHVIIDDSTSFEYKSSLLGKPAASGVLENAEIVVPLKYLSNFFRSLEMPLINCKIHLELSWRNDCVMSTIAISNNKYKIVCSNCYFIN